MNIALRPTRMTQEEFFLWAEAQDERYEFDGFQPVLMTGGTISHSRIARNISFALGRRLAGGPCEPLGPDAGVATVGKTVRYPDGLISCTRTPGNARLTEDVTTVFEVVSPSSEGEDRIVKVDEYFAVASIQHYVIIDQDKIRLTVHGRQYEPTWSTVILTEGDTLKLPDLGLEIPVAEFYQGVLFEGTDPADA